MIRVGFGYDAHRLVPDRPLIIGGVDIPHDRGLQGHSDADVLLHAICDALLGAAALGDLGCHFPDTDPEFEGVSSMALLRRVGEMIKEAGFELQLQVEPTNPAWIRFEILDIHWEVLTITNPIFFNYQENNNPSSKQEIFFQPDLRY